MYAISTAGGFVGALLTPALQRRFRPAAIFRAAAVIDCGATLAILPLDSPYLIGAAGAAAFFLAPAVTASLFGTLSLHCPDELAGRAQASLSLIVGAAAPIAPVAIGLVLDRWGATIGITVLACVFASLAIVAFVIPAVSPDPRLVARAAPRGSGRACTCRSGRNGGAEPDDSSCHSAP